MPHLAPRDDKEALALKGEDVAIDVAFDYSLADFISFRNREACERVRRIKRSELARHPNPDFKIRVADDPDEFYTAFAEDIVSRIQIGRASCRERV